MALALANGSLLKVQNSRSESRQRLSPVSVRISSSEIAINLENPSSPLPYVRLPDALRKCNSAPAQLEPFGAHGWSVRPENGAAASSSTGSNDPVSFLTAQFQAWMSCCASRGPSPDARRNGAERVSFAAPSMRSDLVTTVDGECTLLGVGMPDKLRTGRLEHKPILKKAASTPSTMESVMESTVPESKVASTPSTTESVMESMPESAVADSTVPESTVSESAVLASGTDDSGDAPLF